MENFPLDISILIEGKMQNNIKNIFKYTMPITITFYSSLVLGNELEIQKLLYQEQ